MGSSKDYPNVAEWKTKDTGYHTGDMVKYKSNIFRAAYWAGKEPGVDPGWSLYDELYDETSHSAAQPAKVIGYLPTWRKDLDYGNAVIYQNITHGIIAFLQFDEKNLGELDDKTAKAVTGIVQQVVTTAHKAGTYISVAIGGATDYGFLNLLTAVGSNASDARLDKAVQNVAKFVKDNALDGVDLDLECWWDANGDAGKDQGGRDKTKGAHPAGSALVSFAQKLKAALPGKLISATLFATSWYGNNYDPKLADQVDWLSIMSYDLTGSWNQSPVGPHTALLKIRKQDQYTAEQQGQWPGTAKGTTKGSTPQEDNPIFSVEDSLWYWSNPFFVNWQGPGQRVARNKLVAGVPLYGYDFAYKKDPDAESGQTPPGFKVLRYKELLQQFPGASTAANANIKVSGNTPRPSFISASGSYPYAHNIYLETPDTAVAKLKFLKQLGMQGVIIWEMSNEVWDDGTSIVKALYKASGNPATRPALPAPSFAQAGGNGKQPVHSGDLTGQAGQAEQTTDFKTNGTPGIAIRNDVLFAVYENRDESNNPTGDIWYTSFKNGQWADGKNTHKGTTGAPALIVYKDKLYAFHEGKGQDGTLWFMRGGFDGSGNFSWEIDEEAKKKAEDAKEKGDETYEKDNNTKFGITGAPALAIFNDKLFIVHLAKGGRPNQLWWACYDGSKWVQSDTELGDQRAATTPSLAVWGDKLYCAYQGADNGQFWYVIYEKDKEGNYNWTSGNRTKYATYGAPSLAAYNNKLHAFHEGYETYHASDAAATGASLGATSGATVGTFAAGGNPVGTAVGAAAGAVAGAVAGTVAAGVDNAVSSPRSYKLWYTGCEKGKTDFTAPEDTETGFGVTDPPSLAVSGNKLYCVHGGRAGNGQICWFSVNGDTRSGDGQLNGTTASPPALAELKGELYCVYEKGPGGDGHMAWTKLPASSQSDSKWVETKGANSYRYYKLDNTATGGAAITGTKTATIDSGAPFLYAVLIESTESADFPSGATLKITGPDGKTYNAAQDDDQVYALTTGNSLCTLVIKNPKAGDYKVELTVPQNISFYFELATLPSKDIGQTILDASSGQGNPSQANPGKGIELQTSRKGKGKAPDTLRPSLRGMAAVFVGYLTRSRSPSPEPGEPGPSRPRKRTRVDDLATAATDDALGRGDFSAAPISPNVTVDIPPDRPAALSDATRELALSVPTVGPVTGESTHRRAPRVRIATWNVYHGNWAGRSVGDRMHGMLIVGARQRLGIIAFQEVPRGDSTSAANDYTVLNIRDHAEHPINTEITTLNREYGTDYAVITRDWEYPGTYGERQTPPTTSATSDGYVIIYDRNQLTPEGVPAFYHPERFQRGGGLSQARPPFRINFEINDTDGPIQFSFFTWHAEADSALASTEVGTLYELANEELANEEGEHYIIAGDLNVDENKLQGAVEAAVVLAEDEEPPRHIPELEDDQEVHYYAGSLDFVISDQTVEDAAARVDLTDAQWEELLKSDAHIALLGEVHFNKPPGK